MNRELILTNKAVAETLVAHLSTEKSKAILASKDDKFVVSYEIKAEDESCMDEKLCNLAQYLLNQMDAQMRYMYQQLDAIYNWMGQHSNGHLPNLTPSALEKLIKAAGLQDDYQVVPRTLYANTEKGIEFSATELKRALDHLNKEEAKQDGDVGRLLAAIQEQRK